MTLPSGSVTSEILSVPLLNQEPQDSFNSTGRLTYCSQARGTLRDQNSKTVLAGIQMKQSTDVVIIGAGPTGLSLASQLIRYGIDFVILDKREGVTPYSKAIGVHARTLEIYEQIDLGQRAISEGAIAGKGR